MLNKNTLLGSAMMLLSFSTVVSAEDSSAACIETSKQFFLEKMPNNIGPNATPRKDRPDLIRGLMMRIKVQHPDSDMLACMNDGLIAARASRNIVVPDKMHGGVRSND